MASNQSESIPDEPPPSYSQAVASSSSNNRSGRNANTPTQNDHLAVPGSSAGRISAAARRSMEDQGRPLPKGWVRCYDDQVHHQFFVDTTKTPPRSIWVHPYDDKGYLSTLSDDERSRIEHENRQREEAQKRTNAIHYDSDTDSEQNPSHGASSSSAPANVQLPPRPNANKEKPSLGRKLKDKLTGMTHEEREAERQQRAEAEKRAYEQHLRFRQAMARAAETGQPQLLGRDQNGKEVYVEPPPAYGAGFPGASRGYGPNAYGYNPYAQGMYASPNSAYMRPGGAYGRPYGRGYGGGYGMPLALGGGLIGGGLLGGLLLTDLMF